jgi:hypothetical protein
MLQMWWLHLPTAKNFAVSVQIVHVRSDSSGSSATVGTGLSDSGALALSLLPWFLAATGAASGFGPFLLLLFPLFRLRLFGFTESTAAATVSTTFCTGGAEELATTEGSDEGLNSEAAGFNLTGRFVTLGGTNEGRTGSIVLSAAGSTWLPRGACFGFGFLDRELFVALPAVGWVSAGVVSISILIVSIRHSRPFPPTRGVASMGIAGAKGLKMYVQFVAYVQ